MFEFLLALLATFGVSALVSYYDGLADAFVKVRSKVSIFNCCVCLSVWVAIPITIVAGLGFIEYLAIVGSVIIIERFS